MKILKTLALLFVLLALTVGAVAEEFTAYSIAELQEMEFALPVGMDEAVTDTKYSDGLVQIYVDSDKVKWAYIAAQSTEWAGAEIFVHVPFMDGADRYRAMIGGNSVGSANTSTNLTNALEDMWAFLEPDNLNPTGEKATFRTEITSYSSATGAVTPIQYSGNRALMIMNAQYSVNENGVTMLEDGLKYALIELVYTNNSSVKVEGIEVPSERIKMDANAQDLPSYKSNGVVVYKLTTGNQFETLTTEITAPDDAASVISSGEKLTIENGRISIPMSDIPSDDYYASEVVNLLWYKADGTVLDAERLVISVEVGDPIVWPNYIQKQNFTKADVNVYFTKDDSKVSTGYMTADYSTTSGTVTVSSNASIASANEDMTKYGLRVELTPPSGAAYGTSYGTVAPNALGKNPNGYTLDSVWNMYEDLMQGVANVGQDDPAYVKLVNKKAYFDDVLFKETTYKNDPGLTVYYDANLTDKATVTLQIIDWRAADGTFISRQWYAVQFAPLAYTDPVEIETAAPADADTPVLVAETAVEGYTLRVQSYPQTSDDNNQIHYELELLDVNGENVSLSELRSKLTKDVQLLLPYQTADGIDDETVVYTVNHYDANGGLKESVTEGEGSVTLTRVEGGVLMTIKSLSPFVLSWQDAICEHKNLTYTTDKNTITEVCENTACDHKATWTIAVEESCVAGTEIGYKVTHTQNWLGGDPTIEYGNEATMEISSETPTEPGEYYMFVKKGNAVLSFKFKVTAAPVMPATGDNSLPLAMMAAAAALAMGCAFMLSRKARKA